MADIQQHRDWLKEKAIALEKSRKSLQLKNTGYKILKTTTKVLKLICFIASVVAVILTIFMPPIGFAIAAGAFVLYLLIGYLEGIKSPQTLFINKLKNEVIPQIFEKVNPQLNYKPKGFNKLALEKSSLLNQNYFANTIDIVGEDYVTGNVDGVDVEFFELKFFKNKVSYGKSGLGCLANIFLIPAQLIGGFLEGDNQPVVDLADMRVVDANIFHSGLFMYADFHKHFNGEVLMIPKKQERIEDKILAPNHLQKIEVENSIIRKNYNIYASQEQLGFYVLSISLVDRIQELSTQENVLPMISFRDGKMFMMIPWSKDYFSADIKQPIEGATYFENFFEQVESFKSIIKSLNLETRIWTKN